MRANKKRSSTNDRLPCFCLSLVRESNLRPLLEAEAMGHCPDFPYDSYASAANHKEVSWSQYLLICSVKYKIFIDQPILKYTKHFLYADDLEIIAQDTYFEKVPDKLVNALKFMNEYHIANHLKPNPSKAQVYSSHSRNKDVNNNNLIIDIKLFSHTLPYIDYPVCLGVTLDRTLTLEKHCQKIKIKVQTRNNLLKTLSVTHKARLPTIRKTALTLCCWAREYACPV